MHVHEIFLDPAQAFSRINERPNWLKPLLVVSLMASLTILLSTPISEHLALRSIPEGASEELKAELFRMLRLSTYYGIATTPIVILLKWSVLSSFLFLFLILSGSDISFRKTLSLVGHASIIVALDGLLCMLVMYARGFDSIQSPGDLQTTVLSLNHFLHTAGHPLLRVLLDNLGVFSLWQLALLTFGVASVTRFSKWRAALSVGLLWGLQTLFLIGLTLIFSRYELMG